jgi:hypothetical protein
MSKYRLHTTFLGNQTLWERVREDCLNEEIDEKSIPPESKLLIHHAHMIPYHGHFIGLEEGGASVHRETAFSRNAGKQRNA